MGEITVYTDGGSRNNPGPAAIGVFIETLNEKFAQTIGVRTNNEAEYEALIFGLKKLRELLGKAKARQTQVRFLLDSQLVVNQLEHRYKLNDEKIITLFLQAWNLMLDFASVTFQHIPREENHVADALVNQALDAPEKNSKLL